tara:strand:- start:6710 stop:8524 length:1815 start_codon:yes stop_codon:yes gene_type:complete
MVRVLARGAESVDLLVLSAGFGREGAGELTGNLVMDRYSWTTSDGLAAKATGEAGTLRVNLSDVPSGRAETLTLAVAEATKLTIEADRPWIRLGQLAGGDPPGLAFDPILRGKDRFRAEGGGDVRLFGDGVMAQDHDKARADVFELSGAGGRQAVGDFWLVPSTLFQVRMGDDDFRIDSRGAIHVWGDAAMLLDKAGDDGAQVRGGDDRLDARDALEGVRRPGSPVLVGDVGEVGVGWLLRGGDDLLIAPRKAGASLLGDVLSGDGQARLFCGDDVLRGGRGDDFLFGDAQNLVEEGVGFRPGSDVLRGGRGADTLYGDAREISDHTVRLGRDPGADRLFGGAGRDRAEGGWGDDRIFGGEGGDRLYGDQGGDRLEGEAGGDRLWGGLGADRLTGGADGDRLYGEAGEDAIFGGAGSDALWGGAGGDRLLGEGGKDRLRGNGGRDELLGAAGGDRIDGGSGRDALFGGGGGDVARGGREDDAVHGGGGRDRLRGGGGEDELFGGGGADTLSGGNGDDWLEGGAGRDLLIGDAGADVFRLARGGGDDVAEDFDPDVDWLSVARALGAVDVHEAARGVYVSAGGASILLLGVALGELDPVAHDWLG